jgi:tRNA(fMet)-specific endonuclease VapC
MLRYMLDTDICIYVLKNYPTAVRDRFNQNADAICISSITLAELLYGAEKSTRRLENLEAVTHFQARIEVLPYSPRAAAYFGQIRAQLERIGRPCGSYDMLIAAHARSESLTIVTNNTREFERVPGVTVENWL